MDTPNNDPPPRYRKRAQTRGYPHLRGDDHQICLLGVCLLITHVPRAPS
jgi:hypothetical protein